MASVSAMLRSERSMQRLGRQAGVCMTPSDNMASVSVGNRSPSWSFLYTSLAYEAKQSPNCCHASV